MIISPFCEAQIELSGKEFGFEVESARPLMDVAFKRVNSGKDLKKVNNIKIMCLSTFLFNQNLNMKKITHLISILPLVKTRTRPASEQHVEAQQQIEELNFFL